MTSNKQHEGQHSGEGGEGNNPGGGRKENDGPRPDGGGSHGANDQGADRERREAKVGGGDKNRGGGPGKGGGVDKAGGGKQLEQEDDQRG